MAKNKKTFIFYSDWINMVREMPSKDAGELLKHILSYVNDESPITDNVLVKMAFGHMEPMLKSDLVKWENQLQKYKEMGKLSAEKRKKQLVSTYVEPTLTQVEPVNTVNDNVNVNVNETDTVIKKDIQPGVFNFKKSLLDLGIEKQIVSDYLKVRSKKKATNSETAFNSIKTELEKSSLSANESIKLAVIKSWAGFKAEWINNLSNENNQTGQKRQGQSGEIGSEGYDNGHTFTVHK